MDVDHTDIERHIGFWDKLLSMAPKNDSTPCIILNNPMALGKYTST